MGKKSNKKSGGGGGGSRGGPVKLLPQIRIELTSLVDQVFQKATKVATSTTTAAEDWQEFLDIYTLIQSIIMKEKDIVFPCYKREEQIQPLIKWLMDNGVKMESLEITDFGDDGFGLRATKDIIEGDTVITVPRKVMVTEDSAKKSYLGSLIDRDPLLKHMGNVSLSLHLLAEKVNPNSFWQPYLRALPNTYNTTLYFTPEELQMLKGSPQLEEAIKQFRNIARQYAYFYRAFNTIPEARSWPIKDYFTFDAYRWAVSTVMTRINRIPGMEDGVQLLALIPAWDMANHQQGFLSTVYNDDSNEIVCLAQRSFTSSQQFTIHYGQRSNAEFFIHSGFVYDNNENDSLTVKLGVSISDPLHDDKVKLLQTLGFAPRHGIFNLLPGSHPISADLLAFTRIFCMDKDSLDKWIDGGEKSLNLLHEDCDVGTATQDKTCRFLSTRVLLLTRSYTTTLEEDEKLITSESGHKALIRAMLISEKRILKDAAVFLDARLAM